MPSNRLRSTSVSPERPERSHAACTLSPGPPSSPLSILLISETERPMCYERTRILSGCGRKLTWEPLAYEVNIKGIPGRIIRRTMGTADCRKYLA
jgi:hypothetical protein